MREHLQLDTMQYNNQGIWLIGCPKLPCVDIESAEPSFIPCMLYNVDKMATHMNRAFQTFLGLKVMLKLCGDCWHFIT